MWKLIMAAGIPLIGAACLFAEDKSYSFKFAKGDVGKVPAGWTVAKTGKGEGSIWKVVADDTAPSKSGFALAQTAESPGAMFNLCVADDSKIKDGEIWVAFKAIRGNKDQGGGIVWRYRDADNYYVARMNPLENNYRVYKVMAGNRTQLQTKENLAVPVGEWHTLKIKMIGDRIECFLDGKKELDARDSTFPEAGKVGLWSKADAQTYFDNFKVKGN
ncbi:MAG TPA: family 16 glycoside hydrolase [Gemmataceae bacterium]|nr:family 16 glycoside hydrolase [Gemmataceae bacterium]